MITRYRGQPLPITVVYESNPLEPYGKSYSDIIEIRMNLKVVASDNDDAYLEKSSLVGSGVSLDQISHTFSMNLQSADYSGVPVGTYILTLNVQANVGEEFIELDMKDRTVVVTEDLNRA